MIEFFTNHISQAPRLDTGTHLFLFLILLLLIYFSLHLSHKSWYKSLFWWLQFLQVASLYTWYVIMAFPLSESLPFYHCRLAMLFILWGKPGRLKRYFAYLGLFGSLAAFIYPVFDPFAFPHITFFTFVIGHYALAVNCIVYLISDKQLKILDIQDVVTYTVVMNGFMVVVNYIFGGNYGFLSQTPLFNSKNIAFNFLLVTGGVIFTILFVQSMIFAYLKSRKWKWIRD